MPKVCVRDWAALPVILGSPYSGIAHLTAIGIPRIDSGDDLDSLSLAIGLFLLDMFGITINQLSIVGLIVALGLLVDDSIVVVENIERYLRLGYSRKEAAMKATKQIGLAVLGCTATLIFAFLPLMFLPEGAGDFIRSLPAVHPVPLHIHGIFFPGLFRI